MEKLTLNKQMYIDLDEIIEVKKCPNVTDMIAASTDYIRHNCNIRTFDLKGNQIKDAWYAKSILDCDLKDNKKVLNISSFDKEIKTTILQ